MVFGVRRKLMFTYIVLISIILVVVALYLGRTLKAHYISDTEVRLRQEAAFAGEYVLRHGADRPLSYEADSLADDIGRRLNLRVTIIDASGIVRGDSELDGPDLFNMENHGNRLEVLDAMNTGVGLSIRHSYTLNTDMMYVAQKIQKGDIVYGFLRLALPLLEIDHTLRSVRRLIAFSLMIGLVLAFILSYLVARTVTRPLNEMSAIAGRYTRGDFSRKMIVRSGDEISQLAGTLNMMASRLDHTILEITTERDRLRGVLGGMREGVMLTDSEGRIVLTNEAFQTLFGVQASAEGKTVIETIRNAQLHGAIEKTLRENREVIEEIHLHIHPERILFVHIVPLGTPEHLTGTVVVLYDVTQLKRLEKIRRDFVANVSHELNTPLATVKGYTETLLDRALDDRATAEKFLEVIARNVDRMSRLVADLLALSMLESEEHMPVFSSLRIEPVISRVLDMLKNAVEKNNLTVKVNLQSDLSPVLGDEKGLEQVMINLLDNAVKFTPEGGTITISGADEDGTVKISVADTGSGIPSQDLSRIFERFYRVDKDRSRDLGGTGLGLSIVKHIIQSHGGTIRVESEVGRGSTFTFLLPKI